MKNLKCLLALLVCGYSLSYIVYLRPSEVVKRVDLELSDKIARGVRKLQLRDEKWMQMHLSQSDENPVKYYNNLQPSAVALSNHSFLDNCVLVTDNVTGISWTLLDVKNRGINPYQRAEDQHGCGLARPDMNQYNSLRVPANEIASTSINRTYILLQRLKKHSQASDVWARTCLLYNRVPKSASSTFQVILHKMAEVNHFKHESSQIYSHHFLNKEEEEALFNELRTSAAEVSSDNNSPKFAYSFDRHFYFIHQPVKEVGFRPIWINTVRDPVERFVSSFYYLRSEKRWKNVTIAPPKSWLGKNFSDCVLRGDLECQFNPELNLLVEHQLSYFCGSSPECMQVGNKRALQAAKYNVEVFYAVVGIASDMQLTLEVMEGYLPKFFQGAIKFYEQLGNADASGYQRNHLGKSYLISERVKSLLRSNMSLEYEFYDFVCQRLRQQRRKITILQRTA